MTERIFYDDAQMRYLLRMKPVRYTNVYINKFGDQYFGGSSSVRMPCENKLSGKKAIYRIIVRAKPT